MQKNARMKKSKIFHLLSIIPVISLLTNITIYIKNNPLQSPSTYALFGIVTLLATLLIIIFIKLYRSDEADKNKSTPVNPMAEADVYLAYGRKEQAIEILQEALNDSPNNKAIMKKLNALIQSGHS